MGTSFLFYETIIQRTTDLYIKITLQVCHIKWETYVYTPKEKEIGLFFSDLEN